MKEKFIGTWNLVYYKIVKGDGSIFTYPYGKNCKGNILYTKEGRMTALLMNPKRPKFEIAHAWKGTAEEMKSAFRGYTSYAGRFEVEEDKVIHRVDMSLFPNWIGTDLVRTFQFSSDNRELLLSTTPFNAKGFLLQDVLLWERL